MRKYDSKIRSQQAEKTKEQISKVIENLIVSRDIKSVSIKEICKEAQVSVGTFYLYFESKEQALLYNYHMADALFDEISLDDTKSPITNLNIIFEEYINMVDFNLINNTKQIYMAHIIYFDEYFFSWDRALTSIVLKLIEEGQEKNLIMNEYTSKEISIKILRFVRGILYDLVIRTKLIDLDTWKQESVEDINRYIKIFEI